MPSLKIVVTEKEKEEFMQKREMLMQKLAEILEKPELLEKLKHAQYEPDPYAEAVWLNLPKAYYAKLNEYCQRNKVKKAVIIRNLLKLI